MGATVLLAGRLLVFVSKNSLVDTYKEKLEQISGVGFALEGVEGDPTKGTIIVPIDPSNNIPTVYAQNYGNASAEDQERTADMLAATLDDPAEAAVADVIEFKSPILTSHPLCCFILTCYQ